MSREVSGRRPELRPCLCAADGKEKVKVPAVADDYFSRMNR